MTPADAVAAIERLVEAGRLLPDYPCGVGALDDDIVFLGDALMATAEKPDDRPWPGRKAAVARFIAAAANARPALSALAGMCVLPAEVVRVLAELAAWSAKVSAGGPTDDERAAIAAAEAELRRVAP